MFGLCKCFISVKRNLQKNYADVVVSERSLLCVGRLLNSIRDYFYTLFRGLI